jgi:hypothetical protein
MNRGDKELAKLISVIISGLLLMAVILFISFSTYMYVKHPEVGKNVQFKIGK